MNITSFNVTDVGYHYIGLRGLVAMPDASRDEQTATISRSVLKYARDRALKLMLPEPRSNYETIGEKICLELVHFQFASAAKGQGYQITPSGRRVVDLLNKKEFIELRRTMTLVHLTTYSNLHAVVHAHITQNGIWSPSVETTRKVDSKYIAALLEPTFGSSAKSEAEDFLEKLTEKTPKRIEDALRECVLRHVITKYVVSVPIFRSMCDRLVSLRLLNAMRVSRGGADFIKTYSPCVEEPPVRKWHRAVTTPVSSGGSYTIYLSEPDLQDKATQNAFLDCLDSAFSSLQEQAGYFDLPDVRDFVCEKMSIPEVAFDEGVLVLLDKAKAPVTLGLTYERITSRRKPLVRARESTQLFNLIRRA